MELKDTISQMLSDDWKERMIAEYWQTKIRYRKLLRKIIKIEGCRLDGIHVDEEYLNLLKRQRCAMGQYMSSLEVRAMHEDVDLGIG